MLNTHRLPPWAHGPCLTCPGPLGRPWERGRAAQLTTPGVTLTGGRLLGRGWADVAGHTAGDPLTPRALQVLLTPRPAGTLDDEMTLAGWDLVFTADEQPADHTAPGAATQSGAGPHDLRLAAQDAAVSNALSWLDEHATFTRGGLNRAQQIDTRGLLAALLTHREDSTTGRLHTHVIIAHHVCGTDGRWTRLDIPALFRPTRHSSSDT